MLTTKSVEVSAAADQLATAIATFVAEVDKEIVDDGGFSLPGDTAGIVAAALKFGTALVGVKSVSDDWKLYKKESARAAALGVVDAVFSILN